MEHQDSKTGSFLDPSDPSRQVIGACIEVHRHLGPGLLESVYRECLRYELSEMRLEFVMEQPLPVHYKGVNLDIGYRLDVVVENKLIVEIKAVERLLPIHQAQLLTYLKLANVPIGLLVNFNAPTLKEGLRRLTRKDRLPVSLSWCEKSESAPDGKDLGLYEC
jgi:GxxExxY protein